MPRDPFLDVVIEEIRAIRGALALWGVIDIDVDQFLREFVPDTIEENVAMQVKSIKYERWNREKLPVRSKHFRFVDPMRSVAQETRTV